MMLISLPSWADGVSCPRPREDQEWNKTEGRRYFGLGNTFFKTEKYDDAALAFECVLRLVPYSMNTRYRLAESYEMAGDLVRAREQYLLVMADDSQETEELRPKIQSKMDALDQRISRGESRSLKHAAPPPPPTKKNPFHARGLLEDFPDRRHRLDLNFGMADRYSVAPTSSVGYFFRHDPRWSWGFNFGGLGLGKTGTEGESVTGKGVFLMPMAEYLFSQVGGVFHIVFSGGLGYALAKLENNEGKTSTEHSVFASLIGALDYRLHPAFSIRFTLRLQYFLGLSGPGDENMDNSSAGIYEFGVIYRF